jgi:hypothetical protein
MKCGDPVSPHFCVSVRVWLACEMTTFYRGTLRISRRAC